MNYLVEDIKKRRVQLQQEIRQCREQLKKLPKGKLLVHKSRNRYRWRRSSGGKITPIHVGEVQIAEELAYKGLLESRLIDGITERSALDAFLKEYREPTQEELYLRHPERSRLLRMYGGRAEDKAHEWEREDYPKRPYDPEKHIYETRKGELVTSKSEVLIADIYYSLGIPYHYEEMLDVRGRVYVDFIIWSERIGMYLPHEHFGKWGDMAYVDRNLDKLRRYSRCGYVPGVNFIATFESVEMPFNPGTFRKYAEEFL